MVMHNFGGYTRCIMVFVKVNRWTGLDVSRAGVLRTGQNNLKNNDGINYKYIFQVYKFLKGAMHYTIKF